MWMKYFLKIDLAYGRINYLKKSSLSNNVFFVKATLICGGISTVIFVDLIVRDKKKLFKQLSIKNKNKNFDILVKGNLGILNKKINFKNISINENYKASKEDLIYFKETFENIILRDNIKNMFKLKNIKNLLQRLINYFGLVIFIGLIILSYSFSFINPALITSCLRVVPFL